MSRIPFRPGEDISRLLPILRVEGFEPGSPEAATLANHFAGSLRQFYHGQARLAEASGLMQWAKSADRGDHQLRYVSQFGSETVTLRVHPKVVGEVLKKVEEELPWDWAVVDFEVPLIECYYSDFAEVRLIGAISGFYIRCQQVPFERDLASGTELGGAGYSIAWLWSGEGIHGLLPNGFPDNTGRPMVSIENPVTAYDDVPVNPGFGANIDKKSVRIDLRAFPNVPELTFEVYANLITPTDDHDDVYTSKYQGAKLTASIEAGEYTLKVHEDFSLGDVYDLYPNVEALVTATVLSQPDGPDFGKTESQAASYGFAPDYFDADSFTWSYSQQYYYVFDAGTPGWQGDATGGYGMTLPEVQALYQPAQSGEAQDPIGVPEMGVGIFKWVNTAWDYFPTAPTPGPTGSSVTGVVPDPPTTPAQEVGGPPDFEYTVFQGYAQWEWLIFLPVYATQVIDVVASSTMAVSAAMFRGTPPWEAPPYDIPDDPGEWAYSQWEIVGQSPRFTLAQIGETVVSSGQIAVTIPPYPNNYSYDPEVQRDGRPYIGKLVVSPTKGYAVFKPA